MPSDDEIITSANQLDAEEPKPEEAKEANPTEGEKAGDDSPAAGDEASSKDDGLVEVDGEKYKREEVEEVYALGKRIAEYQKTHPGFDPINLHRDYTKKAMELAELKKQQSQPKAQEEKVDLSDVNDRDVQLVEKILKAKGYVKRDDLAALKSQEQQTNYETEKKKQVNAFLKEHPEYRPENDPGDVKWGKLIEEFGLYKTPSDPQKIGELLDRVHSTIAKEKIIDPRQAAKILAQKKANKLGESSAPASGGGESTGRKKVSASKDLAKQYLKGFTDAELEEIFN